MEQGRHTLKSISDPVYPLHKTRCTMGIVIKAKDTWRDGNRDGQHQVAMRC